MAKISKSAAKAAAVIAAMKNDGVAIKVYRAAMGRASYAVIDAAGAVVDRDINDRVMDEIWSMRPIPIKSDPARKDVWIAKADGEK